MRRDRRNLLILLTALPLRLHWTFVAVDAVRQAGQSRTGFVVYLINDMLEQFVAIQHVFMNQAPRVTAFITEPLNGKEKSSHTWIDLPVFLYPRVQRKRLSLIMLINYSAGHLLVSQKNLNGLSQFIRRSLRVGPITFGKFDNKISNFFVHIKSQRKRERGWTNEEHIVSIHKTLLRIPVPNILFYFDHRGNSRDACHFSAYCIITLKNTRKHTAITAWLPVGIIAIQSCRSGVPFTQTFIHKTKMPLLASRAKPPR